MKKVRSKLRPTDIGVIKTFSLSPDDEVGEIAVECSGCTYYYNNLRELCEKWEDVPEEQKGSALDLMILTLTNFIENEPDGDMVDLEDCKQMLDKLTAWKRLKDRHFKFDDYDILNQTATWLVSRAYDQYENDIKLLFGGEE